jgi:type II secretion system protein C
MSDDPKDHEDNQAKKGLGAFFKKVTDALPSVTSKKQNKNNESELSSEDDATMPSFQVADYAEVEDESEIDETLRSIDIQKQLDEETGETTLSHQEEYDEDSEYDEDQFDEASDETIPSYEQEEDEEESFEHEQPIDEQEKTSRFTLSFFKKKNTSISTADKPDKKRRSVNVSGLYHRLFAPGSRPAIHRLFILLLFVGTAVFSARFMATFLNQSLEKMTASKSRRVRPTLISHDTKTIRQSIASLGKNDLFKAKKAQVARPLEPKKPAVDENLICREAKRRSLEKFKLTNTIVLQDIVKSIASVQIRGKGQYLRVGDRIPGVAEIGLISSNKMIFKNLKTGICEYIDNPARDGAPPKKIKVEKNLAKGKKLLLDAAKTGISTDGNNFKIKKSFRDKAMSNMSKLITEVRAVQIKNPDGTLSFRMQEIVPDSIFTKLDLKDNDIVDSINGKKFTNMNEIMSLFGTIKDNDHFEISIRRNGAEVNREYDFVN